VLTDLIFDLFQLPSVLAGLEGAADSG